jgi:hypothetical protein
MGVSVQVCQRKEIEKIHIENEHVTDNVPENPFINVRSSDSDTNQEDEDKLE